MAAKESSYETCNVCCVLLKTSDIFSLLTSLSLVVWNVSTILLAPSTHTFFGKGWQMSLQKL